MAEDIKEYRRRYYQEHREEKRKYSREHYQKHEEEYKKRRKRSYKKQREKRSQAVLLLGSKCFFCKHEDKRLIFHKKDGQSHKKPTYYLVLKNPNDFVLLCLPCHQGVHWIMKYLGMSWERIYALLVNKYKGVN